MTRLTSIKSLEQKANQLRQELIKMLVLAGSGHTAGPLGLADLMTVLYFNVLNQRPRQPMWPGRDRLILSAGHNVPIRYVAMAEAGFFPKAYLKTLRRLGSKLQGHPSLTDFPAMETSGGPLGQGISVACGLALAAKMDKAKWRMYAVMSDGELNEGQSWEALMLAAKYKLANLTVFIDRNNIQISGRTEKIMPLNSVSAKLKAFNWKVLEINGHDIRAILEAVKTAKAVKRKPTAIVLKTTPGKGVSFMENKYEWHGKAPDREQGAKALKELQSHAG